MPPPKGNKKEANPEPQWKIDDPINSDEWRCVVVMAVEKTYFDNFVVKEFTEESSNGRRREICQIDYDTLVKKVIKDFANGELSHKYAFVINFSSIFQEAVECFNKKMELPLPLLVKIIKIFLFNLKEESILEGKKKVVGCPDPIKAMAERQGISGTFEVKKKEVAKKPENGLNVRPPSVTKQDTVLLKRGERAKEDQCIDDAPSNGYFSLYILLTGFYNPELPVELIKAKVPLHALICIDTSFTGMVHDSSAGYRFQRRNSETKGIEIRNFWSALLKLLWDSKTSFYFKDVIFQVYVPQRLRCEKKQLQEFIYKEISYLMYDLSDLKRQLFNYLDHMDLTNVAQENFERFDTSIGLETYLPNDCVTAAVVLQCIIDALCGQEEKYSQNSMFERSGSEDTKSELPLSLEAKFGSCPVTQSWSNELRERKEWNLLKVYFKTKELDELYDFDNKSVYSDDSDNSLDEFSGSQTGCNLQNLKCEDNMREALIYSESIFRSYWEKYKTEVNTRYNIDYCLYSLFMTRVFCSYQANTESSANQSYQSFKKNSNYEIIENLSTEMRKPHFTVTDGSRSILKAISYKFKDTSRDFFCPKEFKIVSPEKIKASSAPEFRVTPAQKIHTLVKSETFSRNFEQNPYKAIKGIIDDCLLSNTAGFEFIEFLSKSKLLQKEIDHEKNYNCIDHTYSFLNDCIFILLHNRKDSQNIHHETFNAILKTPVGLRDFYDYVTEDEADWLILQEEMYQTAAILANKMLEASSFKSFSNSDFWLQDSIKYRTFGRATSRTGTDDYLTIKHSSSDKMLNEAITDKLVYSDLMPSTFDGYDIEDMAIQFSGLKTIYYSNDCSTAVQLIEKLYGEQNLSVHATAASHTLYLHSLACPEPHVLDPFTFHLISKNGIVVAFGRRFVEVFEEVEEVIESRTTIKGKKNSSEMSTRTIKRQISKTTKDDKFFYDMTASLPNGLVIRTVRAMVEPCYIKQYYLPGTDEVSKFESCRLFLPNGDLVKMSNQGTVQILKVNASIVTANLSDLVRDIQTGKLHFEKYEIVTGEGQAHVIEDGKVKTSKRFPIFQNTDVETNQIFYRRMDGTNYVLRKNGTFCVEFKDGTRMSNTVSEKKISPPMRNSYESESGLLEDYVVINNEIIVEHPNYATVIFNSEQQNWKVLLPFGVAITVKSNGCYFLDVDEQTELEVEVDNIQMKKYSSDRQLQCAFTANLSVFENPDNESATYCCMEDSEGKTFKVEGNSNCYVVNTEESVKPDFSESLPKAQSELSEFVGSTDLQVCSSSKQKKGKKLSQENKYFVMKRDLTGLEILHVDEAAKALTTRKSGSLIFSQTIPGTETRCFVLISPSEIKKTKKWQVESIIPNPKFETNRNPKTTSSTYGAPPSWMHPFPKKKFKFVVPQPLACRVFVETKRTNFSPEVGGIDCSFCEMENESKLKEFQIPQDDIEGFFTKLQNNDQETLKEMYSHVVASLINEQKKSKPVASEKLEKYLEKSRSIVDLREYHKMCIKYHIIPKYFLHPAGMSWLILNELVIKISLYAEKIEEEIPSKKVVGPKKLPSPLGLGSRFSLEEIEYDLSVSAGQSFSDLSYRSDLSAHTAPAVLRAGGFCRCKVRMDRDAVSSPAIQAFSEFPAPDDENIEDSHPRICNFETDDLEKIEKGEIEEKGMPQVSLEDLMFLGLI